MILLFIPRHLRGFFPPFPFSAPRLLLKQNNTVSSKLVFSLISQLTNEITFFLSFLSPSFASFFLVGG